MAVEGEISWTVDGLLHILLFLNQVIYNSSISIEIGCFEFNEFGGQCALSPSHRRGEDRLETAMTSSIIH